ncbi:hypothetical protein SASPL_123375 [Salvia splendens]|uniref:Uncharacterized protein n=1 Tax=Salvia splendens TaxID=180675 RepID=A0A8X8XN43_SALSN|nr:hypothetical protein SASPL_123375 [Salvia splendens]
MHNRGSREEQRISTFGEKDKFKFFYKATLLEQVDDLLKGIGKQLNDANGLVSHLEDSLRLAKKELDELQEKIKNMEVMEEITQHVQLLRKKLAWSWVYDADRKLDAQHKLVDKLKGRIPSCQVKIDQNHEQLELTGEQERINMQIANMVKQVRSLKRHIQEMNEQYEKNTQAEESEMEERLMELQVEVEEANIEDIEKSNRDIASRIREIQMHQRNKVTAFGGGQELEHGDMWAMAIETAVGRLLNAFIVTDHKDSRFLTLLHSALLWFCYTTLSEITVCYALLRYSAQTRVFTLLHSALLFACALACFLSTCVLVSSYYSTPPTVVLLLQLLLCYNCHCPASATTAATTAL